MGELNVCRRPERRRFSPLKRVAQAARKVLFAHVHSSGFFDAVLSADDGRGQTLG
jgi:hypothetical protein